MVGYIFGLCLGVVIIFKKSMKKINKLFTFLPILLIFWGIPTLNAQSLEEDLGFGVDSVKNESRVQYLRFLELGVSANAYSGDLSGYQKWTACYHIGLKFNHAPRLNGRIGLHFGAITGENRTYQYKGTIEKTSPNIFFRTNLLGVEYELQFHFLKKHNFGFYISQGIGFMQFVPRDENATRYSELLDTRAIDESFSQNAFCFPTSIGGYYLLKNGYGIGAQGGIINPQTDYLDNISQWGNQAGNDQILRIKFFVLAPLKMIFPKKLPKKRQYEPQTHFGMEN